ncbi:hypothetical protein ACJ41O_014045 [Fusarium nematophilum]
MSLSGSWDQQDVAMSMARNREFPNGPYIHGQLLGQGGYGTVYKVLRVHDGGVFAGKTSPKAVAHLRKEAAILRSLNHGHIVKYVDYYEEKECEAANLLVLELCPGGNLQTLINNHPEGIGRRETLQVMLQLCQALEYLHGKNRFHGDLKPRNILIRTWSPVIDVVIADCAEVMSVSLITNRRKAHGTRAYWAPTVFRNRRHSGTSDDIWALGVSLLGMMSQSPRSDKKEERMYPRRCFVHAQKLQGLNPGDNIVGLLNRLLEWDEKQRIGAPELVGLVTEMIDESEGVAAGDEANRMDLKTPDHFERIEFW